MCVSFVSPRPDASVLVYDLVGGLHLSAFVAAAVQSRAFSQCFQPVLVKALIWIDFLCRPSAYQRLHSCWHW